MIRVPLSSSGVIDTSALRNFCGFQDYEQFTEQHRQWIQAAISNGKDQRESCWTESIAVGGIGFVEETKSTLGIMEMGRRIEEQEAGLCVLKEDFEPYSDVFDPENGRLSLNNSSFRDVFPADSVG